MQDFRAPQDQLKKNFLSALVGFTSQIKSFQKEFRSLNFKKIQETAFHLQIDWNN